MAAQVLVRGRVPADRTMVVNILLHYFLPLIFVQVWLTILGVVVLFMREHYQLVEIELAAVFCFRIGCVGRHFYGPLFKAGFFVKYLFWA